MSLLAKAKSKLSGAVMSVLPLPIPKTYSGQGCISEIGTLCNEVNVKNALIVTDDVLPTLGLLDSTFEALKAAGVEFTLFDLVTPDPDISVCVAGCERYLEQKCDGIIAFGGGSSMDCAKMIGVLTTDPKADPKKFAGTFQLGLFCNFPMLIAIPTTAGTGSETTLAAVISWKKEEKKYAVMDPKLVPPYAFLDPLLIQKLPAPITAATGMDALTHAVESYVSPWRTSFTTDYSLRAIKNTFDNLPTCYHTGDDLEARNEMLIASFDAGVAFTRASIGYVHAIAHQLGALFHIPHGVANAMLLHHILDFYRKAPTSNSALDSLAKMTLVVTNRGHEKVKPAERQQLADQFVDLVRKLTAEVEIPKYAKGLTADRVKEVALRALAEAHGESYKFSESPMQNLLDPGYPVPKYMNLEECMEIISKIVDPSTSSKL